MPSTAAPPRPAAPTPCTRSTIRAAARWWPPPRHGIRTPRDLLLVCASEDPAYAEGDPPVTTVTLNPERIGVLAMSALVERVESGHAEATGRLTVPAGLRVRASSLPPVMY
ncbi:substrate-binding domain-containing protein [Streptomyces sp. NPDC059874]|uniref:substrate-binding domain-containing protein n=1 Tax=Streptomyces sp. NPDC059874 TaxID=3346983 RepID=UPI0036621592